MVDRSRRLLIATGATGGHLYPAVVVADYWQKKFGKDSVCLVVPESCQFSEILRKKQISYSSISISGLKRKISLELLVYPVIIFRAIFCSLLIIKSFQPDYIIGFGSYVSFPVVLAGFFRKVPVFLHEQNCLPGLANRCLAHLVRKIFISFPVSARYFPAQKVIFSGYPLRSEIYQVASQIRQKKVSEQPANILILGGSQGATSINQAVLKIFSRDQKLLKQIGKIIHLTGRKDFPVVEKFYRENKISAEVYPYFDDVSQLYQKADLVISRAGAGTVAELLALNLPAILVPYPSATAGHQKANAEVLKLRGQGYIVEETANWPENFHQKLRELVLEKQLWYNKKFPVSEENLFSDLPEEIIVQNLVAR